MNDSKPGGAEVPRYHYSYPGTHMSFTSKVHNEWCASEDVAKVEAERDALREGLEHVRDMMAACGARRGLTAAGCNSLLTRIREHLERASAEEGSDD